MVFNLLRNKETTFLEVEVPQLLE